MSNFVRDATTIPGPKVEWDGVSDPVTRPDMWVSPGDYNVIRQDMYDLRDWVRRSLLAVDARTFGCKTIAEGGNAPENSCTTLVNNFHAANPGSPIWFPPGQWRFDGKLTNTSYGWRMMGSSKGRSAQNGTQLLYYGTGRFIENGTDNGNAWDNAFPVGYDGPQGMQIEDLCLSHAAPDTSLASNPGGAGYKAGSYGIWDWRGGNIIINNVQIEEFEVGFGGIQSDINKINGLLVQYAKYGVYLGPKTDQNRFYNFDAYYCDRAVVVDRAKEPEFHGGNFVFCGTDTSSPVEVRRGSQAVLFDGVWIENSGSGYAGTMQGMFSLGEVDGYGAGGSVSSPGGTPTTTAVTGCTIISPLAYHLAAGAYHTSYMVRIGKCQQFTLMAPISVLGMSLFDAVVAIPVGQSPGTSDIDVSIIGAPPSMSDSQLFSNLGGGPAITPFINNHGRMHTVTLGLDTTATHTIRGAITHSAPPNANAFVTNNANPNETVDAALWKLNDLRTFNTTGGAKFPISMQIVGGVTRASGANSVGATALLVSCAGAQSNLALSVTTGDVRLNSSSGLFEIARSLYASNQIAPAALAADQTDWNPSGLADATLIIVTSSVAVNIFSLALNANSAGGRRVRIWNGNALAGANITLKDQVAATGTVSMRFIGRLRADTVLAPGAYAELEYITAQSRIAIF